MIDIKLIRENVEEVIKRLNTRGGDFSYLRNVVKLDEERRKYIAKVEELKNFRNDKSKMIGLYKKEGKDLTPLMKEVDGIGKQISELDVSVSTAEKKIKDIMDIVPNLPSLKVSVGRDEKDNKEVRKYGGLPKFTFKPKPHWDLATSLDIIDFDRAAKITGARFAIYKGLGAKLERALINFMLDLHTTEHGYKEILPPFMVNANAMYGTGQLPKFEEDLFKLETVGYYLIPTAEVPVTNMHMDEIVNVEQLPIKYCSYTPCFRAEAGAAGRDTRGIIRQHQFNKVELVKFCTPEQSYIELEALTNNAETILKKLELPYRVIQLCTGDMGFASALTYDIEVWLPSYNAYKEISSCSNFEDFQARRANIKFKRDPKAKAELVHTLNGSGLAVGRTVAAIIENYQNEDGSITIPTVLRPYFNGQAKINK
jgi:seryl-tRNA synthetase